MTENITLSIDGQEISIDQGKTLLEAARENGIDIPTICFHEATTANGLCRMCVVEVEGMRVLQPAWIEPERRFWRCLPPRWICPMRPRS
jgi:NADP-reducing hydrogenase subunit HndD